MKAPFLLPMLATLCFTGAANSQSPDQSPDQRHREPDRQPRENSEARRPNPEQPRPEARKSNPDQPRSDARPEVRRDEGQRPEARGLAPWQRRSEARDGGPRDGERGRSSEMHRPSPGDHPESARRSPGSGPMPQGPWSGLEGLNDLREQVRMLTRQVHELRAMVEAQRNGMQRLAERRRADFPSASRRGGPGPDSRDAHAPMPPRRDSQRGDQRQRGESRPHDDGGPQEKAKPHGDGPKPQGDREPHGNPPPPK